MCLTIPLQIKNISNGRAELSDGRLVGASLISDLKKGDWVLHTGDFLIKKIEAEEAREILELIDSYPGINLDEFPPKFKNILESTAERELSAQEIEYLLGIEDEQLLRAIYSQANTIRKLSIKDHICIHGIIEFSNYCRNNCLYCGLRSDNDIRRYRMSVEEIVDWAVWAAEDKGYKILVLQSGEDEYYDEERLLQIVRGIKSRCRVFIYLSIGDKPMETYAKLKVAGASGVLYRFETSNSELYAKLHPGDNLAERLDNIRKMKALGYIISSGPIIGLPGQTIKDLANDVELMRGLGVFMPSMGPFIPAGGTPLEQAKSGDFELSLKMIAVTRLAMPKARIPVTTAMETIGPADARHLAFMAGANSVMFNLTPEKYRKDYFIYNNKFFDRERRYEKWALFKGELSYKMLEDEIGVKI